MTTLLPRWMKALLAMTTLIVGSGGIWLFIVEQRHMVQHVEDGLTAIAQLKVNQIVEWRTDQLGEGAEVMASQLFIQGVSDWLADQRGELPDAIRGRLEALRAHQSYRDIVLLSPDGQSRFSLTGSAELGTVEPEQQQALAAAVGEGRPALTDLHSDPGHPMPHLSVVAPLFLGNSESKRLVAAAVFVADAQQFLYPLLQSWPTTSETSETLLIRRDGDDVLFLHELRFQKDAAFRLRIPLSRIDVPAVMAVLGSEGVVRGVDYHGVDVIAVIRAVPGTPWYLVAKQDMGEAFTDWQFESILIMLLLAVSLVATGVTVLVAWQRNLKTSYQTLYEAEKASHARDLLYKALIETALDGVFLVDTKARFVVVNRAYCLMSGYSESELLGMSIRDVEAVETPADTAARIERITARGSEVMETRHRRKDGSVYDVEISARYLPIEGGRFVCFTRDVSERKRAERTLRTMAQMLDVAPDSVTVHDFEGRFLYANRRTFELHGYDEREFMALNLHELDVPESEALIAERMRLIAEKGEATFEVAHFRKDRSTIPLEVSVKVVEWDGKPAVLSIATDISERKRAEEEKEKLRAQLVEAQKMESVGRLAGGVAHDFNNMLAVIIGRTEMVLDEIGPHDRSRADLEEIRKAAHRSTDLTRQLLAFARKQTAAPKVVDLNDVVGDALKMLRRLIGEDIDLVWLPAADLWPVRMDPAQVDQILANLCVNARDAIAGIGKVTIETENVTLDQAYAAKHAEVVSGEYVMLAVSDDGCGMAAEVLMHLFEPFFTTKEAGRGTGLGLATVYGIVKQNNGLINVYSEPGAGTTFKIYLPRIVGAVAESQPAAASEKARGGAETVLLVEDDELILGLGRAILEGLGYRVLTAGVPSEAIRLCERHAAAIRLLITDVVMPEMNGRELADRLKAIVPGIKTVFMSGYTANVIAHHGVLDEGIQFIQKPFTRNDLARKVREVLDQ